MKTTSQFHTLLYLLFTSILFCACKNDRGHLDKLKYGNCIDNIQNQNESGVDCGGVCGSCGTCEDGIKNNRETGVDCGGPNCQSCEPPCTIPTSTIIYTVTSENGLSYERYQNWSSTAQYDKRYGNLSISLPYDFNSINNFKILFLPEFDLFSFVKPGGTAIFKTIEAKNPVFLKINHVAIDYSFRGDKRGIDANQTVYVTRPDNSNSMIVKVCLVSGNSKKDQLTLHERFTE